MGKWEGSRHGHFLLTAAVVVIAGVFSAAEQPADVIVTHARIYTVNAKQTWAEALAVRGEKIVAVGTEQDIAPYRGTSTKVMDAGGRLVRLSRGFPPVAGQDSRVRLRPTRGRGRPGLRIGDRPVFAECREQLRELMERIEAA